MDREILRTAPKRVDGMTDGDSEARSDAPDPLLDRRVGLRSAGPRALPHDRSKRRRSPLPGRVALLRAECVVARAQLEVGLPPAQSAPPHPGPPHGVALVSSRS